MIRDTTAQRIASDWHGGQTSALYALSSSGAILGQKDEEYDYNDAARDIKAELNEENSTVDDNERARLASLLEYVEFHGPRGPVDGWHKNVIRRQK